MASTSATCRPSKWKKNLKQPELERAVKDCDFSYSSDLECESDSKSDINETFEYCDDSGWQKVGVRDAGPKRHDFTASSTGPKINLTTENTPKDYFKLFLTENPVQGFVDETNTYTNNSIASKQLSPHSTRVIPEIMHTAHALPTPWTCAVLVLCVSSVSTSEQVSTSSSPLFRNPSV
jgi:hypothetical protein